MCRLLAYAGPEVDLETLLVSPEHSLMRQSHSPRRQSVGKINADGFGVGWYDARVRSEPAVYRTTGPAWSDTNFRSIAAMIRTPALLAAVRSATPPNPVEIASTAPFSSGPWLFAHNGSVKGYPGEAAIALRRAASETRLAQLSGASDSALLFAVLLSRLDDGLKPDKALAETVVAGRDAGGGRFNFLLHDGSRILGTRCGDTLFLRQAGGAVVIASEPFDDDPLWTEVSDGSLISVAGETAEVTVL